MCMTINSGFCLPALRQSPGFLVGRKQRKLNIPFVFKGLLIMPLELSSVGKKEVKWLRNYRNATLGGPCPCLHVSLSSGLPVFMSPCLPVFRSSCLHVSMTSGPHVFMSLTVSYAWVMLVMLDTESVMLDTVHVVLSTVAPCSPGADPDYNSIDHASHWVSPCICVKTHPEKTISMLIRPISTLSFCIQVFISLVSDMFATGLNMNMLSALSLSL